MFIFSIIVFVVATILLVFGIIISSGKINLINGYPLENVLDKEGYSNRIALGLLCSSIVLYISAILALFSYFIAIEIISIILLLSGIIGMFLNFIFIDKKYKVNNK